ncbi:MAG: helix-turn-helix transcriptional regulator [Clostridia bacterium]|nr:helix-turn-helix transcriptional regulator [Clostridia bacterium]
MKATYVKTKLNSLINISKIVTIHYYEFDRKFVYSGESHDFWEMVYVDKGNVEIQRDEERIILKQGEIVFHKPDEFHAIKAVDSSPNFFVVSFVCDSPSMVYLEKYHTTLDRTLKGFISSVIKESEDTYIIPKNDTELKKLEKKENARIGGEQLIKTYLEQLLIFLIRSITDKGTVGVFPTKESMESHIVVDIKEFITSRLEESVRICDICREFGYSKSYISKIFREQTGETLSSYAIKKRVECARMLIREDDLNFAQISAKLNFDNPQYFSRVFKRVTGMTPSEFKRSLNI